MDRLQHFCMCVCVFYSGLHACICQHVFSQRFPKLLCDYVLYFWTTCQDKVWKDKGYSIHLS